MTTGQQNAHWVSKVRKKQQQVEKKIQVNCKRFKN